MAVLEKIEPKRVFHYFEEICGIPHGSYNVDKISDYLVGFAKEQGLRYVQDEYKNVIIYKEASKGYEDAPVLIIQGHMDMVAVKEDSCSKDMAVEGLDLETDGKFVFAKGTSLGGDDGIAVAYALAILEDDSLEHPALEVLITTNEEVGMDGAIGVDSGLIKGKMLLNIDSEEEGVLTVGCAGGTRLDASYKLDRVEVDGQVVSITLQGLTGGHSGTSIYKENANSNVLMGRILGKVREGQNVYIVSIDGGEKTNAISKKTKAVIKVKDVNMAKEAIDRIAKVLKEEYRVTDPGLEVSFVTVDHGEDGNSKTVGPSEGDGFKVMGQATCGDSKAASLNISNRIINLLIAEPDGVIGHNQDDPSKVETSLNIGIVETVGDSFSAKYEIRSSVHSKMEMIVSKVRTIAEGLGATVTEVSSYPEWEINTNSKLQKVMTKVYEEMYGKKPEVELVHAGLECAVLAKKLDSFDGVSIGPDIHDIHTFNEKLDIESTARCYEYVLNILKELKNI